MLYTFTSLAAGFKGTRGAVSQVAGRTNQERAMEMKNNGLSCGLCGTCCYCSPHEEKEEQARVQLITCFVVSVTATTRMILPNSQESLAKMLQTPSVAFLL